MKSFFKQTVVSLGIISVVSAGFLYAEDNITLLPPPSTPSLVVEDNSTLISPPTKPELDDNITVDDNDTLEFPPTKPELDDNGTTGDDDTNCNWDQYKSPITGQCMSINPVTLAELTNGVWVDVEVDLSDPANPTPTGSYIGCTSIVSGGMYSDLNISHTFKEKDGTLLTENSSYAYYDEYSGSLMMEFMVDEGGYNHQHEYMYVTREGSYTFLIKEDYYTGTRYVDGLIQNMSQTCSDPSIVDNIIYVNDYFNPNTDKNIQISGHVYIPENMNSGSVSVQAIADGWNWLSNSSLDEDNGNAYTLGLDTPENITVHVEVYDNSQYIEYFYNGEEWVEPNWSNPDFMNQQLFNVDANITNLDLNISQLLASKITLEGNVSIDTGSSVYLDFLNVQNGSYFGYTYLTDSNTDFSVRLPSKNPGDKYIVSASIESNGNSESFFIDLGDPSNPKLISSQNINWKEGENGIWLPEVDPSTYLVLNDSNSDGTITNDEVPGLSLTFESSALDSQFYVIEGNVTVPSGFSDTISFEVSDKDTGEWLSWSELDSSNCIDNVCSYKIKLSSDRNVTLRANYESNVDGYYTYEGYYVDINGTLTSENNIDFIPVLKDYEGNQLLPNGMSEESCFSGGYFWYQIPGESGVCYDQFPNEWIADIGDRYVYFTDQKAIVNIDFAAIEDSVYKLKGEITVPSDFVPSYDWNNRSAIIVEVVNADTGEWIGSTEISGNAVEGKPNTYAYSMKLQGVDSSTNLFVKLIKEQSSYAADNYSRESYYLEFASEDNSTVVGFKKEESVQWAETDTTDDWGNYYWAPELSNNFKVGLDENNKTTQVNVDYVSVLSAYISNRMLIAGSIKLTETVTLGQTYNGWNSVRVELINTSNGEWIGSDEASCTTSTCSELTYGIEVPNEGNYTLKLVKDIDGLSEEFYYNFGADHDVNGTDANTDKIVNGQKVEWGPYADNGNWMPSPEKAGWVSILSGTKNVDFDFASLAASQRVLAGEITVLYDFVVGSLCTNGNDATVKTCSWDEPDNTDYNYWYGSKNLRVEVLDAQMGYYVASVDVNKKVENTNDYEFRLVLDDDTSESKNYIVKITKEENVDGQWKYDEVFYNFGTDHTYSGISTADGEKLVNGKKVAWGYFNNGYWMPNLDETGYISMTDSVTDFYVDISNLGANDLKVKGKVTFKSDFDITAQNNYANISAIDASNGQWIANTPVNNDGSFELNVGEEVGEYILQVNYSHEDYTNWQNSWYKNKYYDFGADKTYGTTDDTLLNESEVRWVPKLETEVSAYTTDSACWQSGNYWDYESGDEAKCYEQPEHWVPNVNGLSVQANVEEVNIDLSAVVGNTLEIEVTNFPQGSVNKYVRVVNPMTYADTWQNVDGNSTTITEIKDGNYTVEFGYELNGQYKNFFMSGNNNSAVPSSEVRWADLGNGVWGPDSRDTTYLYLTQDTNISITIPVVALSTLNVTVNGVESGKYVDGNLKSVAKPYGAWEQNTSVGTTVGFTFSDVKDGDFILSFNYDGNEYAYDADTNTVKKDPEWIAKDENGDLVCGGSAGWECNWDNSANWIWTPDVTYLNISDDTNITINMPTSRKISGVLDLDPEYAGKNVWVNVYKNNSNEWNGKNFTLDANGDVNGSIKVNGGEGYRIELYVDGLGNYVYDLNATGDGNSGWVTQMKSWDQTTWMPKASTLITINEDLNLGTIVLGAGFNTVTILLENLDTQDGSVVEEVWVSLESETEGYFGEGNANWEAYPVKYDSNVTLKVPSASDYKLYVWTMNHKAGYASDNNGNVNTITNATKLGWSEVDTIDATSSHTITVTLPVLANLKSISGTVICKDTTSDGTDNNDADANCEGWISAWNNATGNGAVVNKNGTFTVKGLDAAVYNLYYESFDPSLNQLVIESSADLTSASVTDVKVKLDTDSSTGIISGNVVKNSGDTNPSYTVVLLEVAQDGTFKKVSEKTLDSNGNFEFASRAKPSGKSLVVAVASRTFVDGASTIGYDRESAVEVYDESSVDIPSFTADLADTFTITTN